MRCLFKQYSVTVDFDQQFDVLKLLFNISENETSYFARFKCLFISCNHEIFIGETQR